MHLPRALQHIRVDVCRGYEHIRVDVCRGYEHIRVDVCRGYEHIRVDVEGASYLLPPVSLAAESMNGKGGTASRHRDGLELARLPRGKAAHASANAPYEAGHTRSN